MVAGDCENMPCYRPLKGYRTPEGGVSFSLRDGYHDRVVKVACGQCTGCRLEKSRQWAIRCVHEAQMHDANSFLTLTYDQQNLPPHNGLEKKAFPTFARALRRRGFKFRYFHVGEYGDRTLRPHYHALIFGEDFSTSRTFLKSSRAGYPLYRSELLDEIWGKGFVNIGEVTPQSAAYVARYAMKKLSVNHAETVVDENGLGRYERLDTVTGEVVKVEREFATMSRNPGIGATWLRTYATDLYPCDYVVHDGKKARIPEYYDRKIGTLDPEGLKALKQRRQDEARKHLANNTEERLRVREIHHNARAECLTREI